MRNVRIVHNIKDANAITHAGSFHADEIMATVMLAQFQDINLMRVLEVPKGVSEDIIVYDIGEGKFDHHQKDVKEKRPYSATPYASAGLIWKEYYREILPLFDCPKKYYEDVMIDVDKTLIECIDGSDNGVRPFAGKSFYRVKSIYQVISNFNPLWDEGEIEEERFLEAVDFANIVFVNSVRNSVAKYKAKDIVEKAIDEINGHTIILSSYMPWEDHIFNSKNDKAKRVWYVIYPSKRGGYSVQCVPDKPGSFGQRHCLPKEWHGLRDGALREKCGIKSAIFVHSTGFMGSCRTLEDAKEMARIAELK